MQEDLGMAMLGSAAAVAAAKVMAEGAMEATAAAVKVGWTAAAQAVQGW